MTWARLARDYAKSAKPRAIEGIGDIYLIRPLGFLLVEGFRRTPATPTFVSILAVPGGCARRATTHRCDRAWCQRWRWPVR